MKKTYIHIGFHKTGTSTIQEGLRINQLFLSQKGYIFPKACRSKNKSGHHNIWWELNMSSRFQKKWGGISKLRNEMMLSNKKIILSSESLCKMNKENIGTLRDQLQLDNVKIIAYLRRQDYYLQAHWAQHNKTGGNRSWEKYVNSRVFVRNWSYLDSLNDWALNFGDENIKIKIFEKGNFSKHIFQEFLAECEIFDYIDARLPNSQNITPGIKTIEVIRYFSNKLKYLLGKSQIQVVAKIIRKYAKKNNWSNVKLNLIKIDTHRKIMDHYKAENQEIAIRFLKKSSLFDETFVEKPVTKYDINDFSISDKIKLFIFILSDGIRFVIYKILNIEYT